MQLEPQEHAAHFERLRFRLDCGREVTLEGCVIVPSTMDYLEGGLERLREKVISRLPELARTYLPSLTSGVLVKPVPDGELPLFTFMVDLVCHEPVSNPDNDISSLIVCWLSDDIETSPPEHIDREVRGIDWDKHAVDGCI